MSYDERRGRAQEAITNLEAQKAQLSNEINELRELASVLELEGKAEGLRKEVEQLIEEKKQIESGLPAQTQTETETVPQA
jgi:oligoendopeptidase F